MPVLPLPSAHQQERASGERHKGCCKFSLGTIGEGQSGFYKCKGYLLRWVAHMGYANWNKIYFDGRSLRQKTIFEEQICDENGNPIEGKEYREPTEEPAMFTNDVNDIRQAFGVE